MVDIALLNIDNFKTPQNFINDAEKLGKEFARNYISKTTEDILSSIEKLNEPVYKAFSKAYYQAQEDMHDFSCDEETIFQY